MLKEVEMFVDGACRGNPGPGGWGALLRYNETEKSLSGAQSDTTNNRMELMAVIEGLNSLKERCHVIITTDSQYVKNGMTVWMAGWKKKGWKTANNKPVKNQDLWEQLDEAVSKHSVEWHWVRGHSGHIENERADELARLAIDTL